MTWRMTDGQDHGVVSGASSAANQSAMVSARSAAGGPNRPVYLGPGDFGVQQVKSMYDQTNAATYNNARGMGVYMGTQSAPSDTWDPIIYVEKVSSASQNAASGRIWDAGCAHFAMRKVSGDSYTAVVSAYGHHDGGSNDLVGMHSRVTISTNSTGGRGWAYWGQTNNYNQTRTPWHVMELNGLNQGVDPGWDGGAQALRINMTDTSAAGNRMSTGVSIGKAVNGGDNGFYTGLNFEAGAIVGQTAAATDGEAIRIQSSDLQDRLIGGIRLRNAPGAYVNNRFKYGLKVDEAAFEADAVLFMGYGQRLQWGGYNNPRAVQGVNDGIQIGVSGNGVPLLLFTQGSGASQDAVRVNGQRVLSQRQNNVPKINAGSTNNDTKNNVINAIITVLRAHGLIDPSEAWTN
ncbi:hypothetical protein [Aureimonas sp. N4]|uniref:hypothetical protein n=1 Tax=Aureimonas sp. N4 TaxID=1638165 RepID=UPI000B112B50|nr:hypothetical protein [Aureimonas sp. N4]